MPFRPFVALETGTGSTGDLNWRRKSEKEKGNGQQNVCFFLTTFQETSTKKQSLSALEKPKLCEKGMFIVVTCHGGRKLNFAYQEGFEK